MTIDAVRIMRETFAARVEHHPTVGSTNDLMAQRAASGIKDLPLLIVTDEQTAGRGRGGNRWWTGHGALALSLLVDARTVAADESRSPLVSLAAAVAVVETVAPLIPDQQVGIHWPNDVFVCSRQGGADIPVCHEKSAVKGNLGRQECLPHQDAGRKLAGILVEVLSGRKHVIGIGLNTNNTMADAPPELRTTAATIRDLSGREHNQTGILIELLRRLEQEFARLRDDSKAVTLRADELCLQRGRTLTIRQGNSEITGRCQGIAPDGAIRLETPAGVESFYSGTLTA